MSGEGNDLLSLADLPSDIIREIVNMELESIDEIRMISPRWNSVSTARLSDRKGLPTIERFSWINRPWSLRPMVGVANQYRFYFGVAEWNSALYGTDESGMFSKEFAPTQYELMDRQLTRIFDRCSILQRFVIAEHKCWNFDRIRNTLRDVIIRELDVVDINPATFDSKLVLILRNFMQNHSIQKVFLLFLRSPPSCYWSVFKKELEAFVRSVTPTLQTVELQFEYNYEESQLDKSELQNLWQARMVEVNADSMLTMNPRSVVIKIQRNQQYS